MLLSLSHFPSGSKPCRHVCAPIREQTVLARLCTIREAAKSSLACADRDLPAASACSLLLNPDRTVNHTKSDREIHTYAHADRNIYHLCTKHKQNSLLWYIFAHFCFGYYLLSLLENFSAFFSFYYRGHIYLCLSFHTTHISDFPYPLLKIILFNKMQEFVVLFVMSSRHPTYCRP